MSVGVENKMSTIAIKRDMMALVVQKEGGKCIVVKEKGDARQDMYPMEIKSYFEVIS